MPRILYTLTAVALTLGSAWAQPGYKSSKVTDSENSYTYYNYKPAKRGKTQSAPVVVEVPAATPASGPRVIHSYPAQPSAQEIQMGQALPPHPPGMPQYPMPYAAQGYYNMPQPYFAPQPYYFGPQPQPYYCAPGAALQIQTRGWQFQGSFNRGFQCGPGFQNNLTPQRFDLRPGEHPLSIQPMGPR
jgi:hypothetical protein